MFYTYFHLYLTALKGKKFAEYEEASCYLMRNLPKIENSDTERSRWYFDFLNACRTDSANRSIPEFIDPDYKAHLGEFPQ